MDELNFVKLQDLPYEDDDVRIWADNDKSGGLSIFASRNGVTSIFSYSTYGLKKAKQWILAWEFDFYGPGHG